MDNYAQLLNYKTYAACFLGGFVMTFAMTPFVRKLACRLGAIDLPDQRKIHKQATPLMGGIGIFLGTWIPILFLSFWDNQITENLGEQWGRFMVVALSAAVIMLSGAYDDIKHIGPGFKLAVQIPVAVMFSAFISHFDVINLPFGGALQLGPWGYLFTVMWIIGITNALNLIDGIDGLATGVAFIVAITTAVLAIMTRNFFMSIVMLTMAGACLGFLRYNFPPANIFLGDTGSLMLGVTLAMVSILASTKSHFAASFSVVILILGYPVIDTLLAMLRRGLSGKPIMTADRSHIHHRILDRGLSHYQAVVVIYIFCIGLSALALALVSHSGIAKVICLVTVSGMFLAGLYLLGFYKLLYRDEIKKLRARFIIANRLSGFLKAKMDLAESPQEIYRLFEQMAMEFDFAGFELLRDNESNQPPYQWKNSDFHEITEEKKVEFHSKNLHMYVSYTFDKDREDLNVEYLLQTSQLFRVAAKKLTKLYLTVDKPQQEIECQKRTVSNTPE